MKLFVTQLALHITYGGTDMKKVFVGAALFGVVVIACASLTGVRFDNGSSSAVVYDINTPAGHQCTVALMNDFRGGIALYCWK
ncbi:hypothetical protein [Burkholderia glumae]|uniref:hypothetical protein n=1 Tax=Burkholderia glumae TaxID=337 RepID=UPI003B991B7D